MAIIKKYDYTVDLFMRMVQVDSPSFEEKNMVDFILAEVDKLGLKCERHIQPLAMTELDEDTFSKLSADKQKKKTQQLQLVFPATDSSKESIFFCAHIDTVMPGCGIKPIISGDRITTDGSTILGSDDKAGVAGMLSAVKHIIDNNVQHGKIVLLFDALEEEGLLGARLVDINKFDVKYGFVLDTVGSVGRIVERVQHSQALSIDVEVSNIPNHAKSCLVDNALTIASDIITKLPKGLWDSKDYTFAQVVKLTTTNEAGYMVPNKATISCTLRSFVKAELDLLVKQYKTIIDKSTYANTKLSYKINPSITLGYDHSQTEIGNMMMTKAEKIFANMDLPCTHIVDGLGGHDASIFVLKGVPTLVLSCGMQDIHTVNEWIYVEDLHNITHTLIKLIEMA